MATSLLRQSYTAEASSAEQSDTGELSTLVSEEDVEHRLEFAAVSSWLKSVPLVFGGHFYVVDNEGVDWTLGGLEFQA